jgi:hypothetical protein
MIFDQRFIDRFVEDNSGGIALGIGGNNVQEDPGKTSVKNGRSTVAPGNYHVSGTNPG